MKLNEYSPDELLLHTENIKNVSANYSKGKELKLKLRKDLEILITLCVDLGLNLLALIPSFSQLDLWVKIVAGVVLAALGIYIIIYVVKCITARVKSRGKKNKMSLDSMLIESAKKDLRYTAIIRIVYQEKNKLLYLTGADFFLPHSDMDADKEINEQFDGIKQSLQEEFNILERDILEIVPIDNKVHFSIKPIHNTLQMNAFVFYDVKLKLQSKAKLIQQKQGRLWLTIDEMKRNPEALSKNKDVIELLTTLPKISNSFVNILGDIKIIWNITSRCSYNCSICATHDDGRTELDASEKLRVLNNICKANKSIKNIDFAGGDPLHFDECTNIIEAAISQLGEDKISVTTTGVGISEGINKLPNSIKHCEITIDAAHSNLNEETEITTSEGFSRGEREYCSSNIDQINTLLEYAETLTINIPIINDDLSDQEIDNLIKKIVHIKEHHPKIDIDTELLRLMPVGKLNQIEKGIYNKYNPLEVVKKIKHRLNENNINCKLHCSLRALLALNEDGCCNMLEKKLGIDCAGNVFSCAWGGYIYCNEPLKKNPFYLGNLTQASLEEILNGDKRTSQYTNILAEINAKDKRHFCSVISYYESKKLFENHDPLAKK